MGKYQPSMSFTELTSVQKDVAMRLAEIEQDDANCCANCGGEDCVCCEIYNDRQRWVSPEELFTNDYYNYY